MTKAIPLLSKPRDWPIHWVPPISRDFRAISTKLKTPWVRSLSGLRPGISSWGWQFPQPLQTDPDNAHIAEIKQGRREPKPGPRKSQKTRLRLPKDVVTVQERLLYMLQPPLEGLFNGRHLKLPSEPYDYQVQGIAFLMPRCAALLADEMGLGKTMQTILALRLLFHSGLIQNALIVCPKPLVHNWVRECSSWAADLPVETICGNARHRRTGWVVSNCPLKIVNYELLTRDIGNLASESCFDVVVLDEAQRIKNRASKTSRAVRDLKRKRSWALTGTPVENRPDDLGNILAFLKPGCVPRDSGIAELRDLTEDTILRRCKEDVLTDLPPKVTREAYLDLTAAQLRAYTLAEKQGVVRLNSLGDTLTVQHVFELIMRLKQICNFDPLTGKSAKLDQLMADLAEVAQSGRKAIVFSQWVEPLQMLDAKLTEYGPLQYHGRIPSQARTGILESFRTDPARRVLLMSYGTGSVGLNLQCANYVFLFDRWWNPAVEEQAVNRAHRIGQRDPVFVTRFVTRNTIEERIVEILDQKRELFEALIAQNGQPARIGLSEDEIYGLFSLNR